MTTTRCKFRCEFVTTHTAGKKSARMIPVYSSDPNSENRKFWEATPSGSLELSWINKEVDFQPDQEYYIDISLAE